MQIAPLAPRSHKTAGRRLVGATIMFGLVFGLSSAASAGAWKKHRGECDNTAFSAPDEAGLKTIVKCVKLWEAYQETKKVSGNYRAIAIEAMKRMYSEGTTKESKIAKNALRRLKVSSLPARGKIAKTNGKTSKKADKRKKKPSRAVFNPPELSKAQKKRADKHFKKGFKQYRKKKYAKALSYYLKMVDSAPGYAKAHYNAACMHSMTDDEVGAIKYLQNLKDMAAGGNKDAAKMVRAARADSDFEDMRDDNDAFKRLTGYAKIKVLNALGEMGEDNADNLEASLKKLGYIVDGPAPSKKKRKHPIIWYSEHATVAAFMVKELLNHPKTKAVLFPSAKLKGFDVIVVWGDKIKGDEPEIYVPDPDDAEDKLDELARKEDEILSHPEEAMDDVNDALDKPDQIVDRVNSNLERPADAVEKVEGTLDKAGDTADRVKGLFD